MYFSPYIVKIDVLFIYTLHRLNRFSVIERGINQSHKSILQLLLYSSVFPCRFSIFSTDSNFRGLASFGIFRGLNGVLGAWAYSRKHKQSNFRLWVAFFILLVLCGYGVWGCLGVLMMYQGVYGIRQTWASVEMVLTLHETGKCHTLVYILQKSWHLYFELSI